MLIGVIADDFTGATDIAGFLVENGLRTTQLIGIPDVALRVDAEAVVISLKSRSCPPEEAVEQSLAALRWLQQRDCKQVFFKYCSTFDSTAKGNIGPVTDALMDALGETQTVICPALPVNGRTIYQGYLFAGEVPLNESGMRHHPITPMQDSNLMRLMEAQARGKAGNVPVRIVEQGSGAVKLALEEAQLKGIRYVVLDAISDSHINILGDAVASMRLVTGGSGLGAGIAHHWSARNSGRETATEAGTPPGGKAVVLSGSCSVMTNAQVAAYRDKAPALAVDVARCLSEPDAYAAEVCAWVEKNAPEKGLAPLVYATVGKDRLEEIQKTYGADAASAAVEVFFSRLAPRLAAAGLQHFIVAGGETSGTIVQSLDVTSFHIGPQIAPGVPWVRATNAPLSLALKSGNFGDERFFFAAQEFFA